VDDDDLFRDLAERHLERRGLEVTTVESAAAALEELESGDVDCVVSDFDMPGADGLELLESVRERDPDIPFVLFTGKGSEEIASEAISAGVTDYLQKQTTSDQFALLANRIERAVTECRTEAALEESERMLSTLVSNLPGIVYRCRNEPGWPMEYIGGNVEEVTGFEPDGFLEGDVVWGEQIAEADRDDIWEAVQDALAEREPFEVTYRFVDADGETRWLREQGRGVFASADDDGPVALEGFITDVTDRKRRERELAEYDRLVDALGDPVCTTDAEGRITTFNERAQAVTGYDADEVVGEHVSKLLAQSDIERGEAVIRELLDSDDGTATYELTVRTADGGELDLENHVALLTHDGEFRGTVGVLRSTHERTDSRLRRLHDATRELMAETDPERIAELTVGAARDILGIPVASVRFARGDVLELVAATDETFEEIGERPPFPIDSSVAGRAYREGEPTVEPDLGELEKPMDPGAARSAAYFPLGEHGVFITAATERDAFDEGDIRLATVLAANVEAALDRAGKEAALRRERDDLAALFENIPDPTVETLMTGGRPIVERVNPAFERVFGYDSDDLEGEDLDEYIVPEDARADAREYNERIEGGQGFHDEVRRLADDGLRDFILHIVPHDVGEDSTRGYAIYTDITEQKQRQRELERQNERIAALHEVATRMRTADDRGSIYDIVIDAAEDILEFDICIIAERDGDVLKSVAVGSGMSIEDYYQETPLDRENNLGAETARERETFVVDDLQESGYAPANFGYASALSVPLGDYGVFQAVAEERTAFSEDDRQLTELLVEHAVAAINRLERERELESRAAELERQNERLDQFASVVSHDLRNPLSVARGRLDLAEMTGEDEHFEAVDRAHDRMEELIEGLLALARQGEMANDPVSVDLEGAAEAAWDTAETGDLSLAFDDPPTVEADPDRLRQLLENLFRNTAEHGGDDVSTVTVGGLSDGFYVDDDGVGIPESERESVLQSGYSGADGTGFGLAIAETIAEAHGWSVAVAESDEGGARFEFRGDPALEND
jgi:PAS domain S-box-containing protein